MYSGDQDESAQERLVLAGGIRFAVERDELRLEYQPKVDCRGGRVVGVEALVRWQHPELGHIEPSRFIPLGEQRGSIKLVTRWVLSEALRQCRMWLDSGRAIPVAINISALDVQDTDFLELVRDLLATWQVSPSYLTLELTEGALLAEPGRALETLEGLDRLGVHTSLDDFGTGYSSLGYLRRFPVRELKIDRSFVSGIVHEARDRAIVRSTVELAHNLELAVVAEGVEDAATLELLRVLGCDLAQGYHLARSMTADELECWLDRSEAVAAA